MLVLFIFRKEVNLLKEDIDAKTFIEALTQRAESGSCPDKKNEYLGLINLISKVSMESIVDDFRFTIWWYYGEDSWGDKEEAVRGFWEDISNGPEFEREKLSPDEREVEDALFGHKLEESAREVFDMVDFIFSNQGWWGDYRPLINRKITREAFKTCAWLNGEIFACDLSSVIFEKYEYIDSSIDSMVAEYIRMVLPALQSEIVMSQIDMDTYAFRRRCKNRPGLSDSEREILNMAEENLRDLSDEILDIVEHPENHRF